MSSSKSLSSLLARTEITDDEEVLKAAEATLMRSSADRQAQHAKVVALLKLDRYADALSALSEGGDVLKSEARLEHAYALYKNGRLNEAQEIASRGDGRRGLKHVEAQATYRMEQFARASDLYKEISADGTSWAEESNDVQINRGATDAQLGWAGFRQLMQKPKPDRQDLEQFETAFNAACVYIAQGEWKQASFLLGRAKDLCNASNELSDEDKLSELLPITTQQIYVLSRLGQHEEAEQLCSDLSIDKLSDPATRHIARSNQLFLSSNTNPYQAHRIFHLSSNISHTDRPFAFQDQGLRHNSMTLDLECGKTIKPTDSTVQTAGSDEKTPSKADYTKGVFAAASHAKKQTGNAAIKAMRSLSDKYEKDVGLLLTIIQLYVLEKNPSLASATLGLFFDRLERSSEVSDLELRYTPGLVALAISLHRQENRKGEMKAELAKASSYWRSRSQSTDLADPLLRAAGAAFLEQASPGEIESAREIFQTLIEKDPLDRVAAAGLAATARSGDEAQRLDELLPSTADLIKGIDADAIEEAGIAKPAATAAASGTGRKRAAPDSVSRSKTKKQRSGKLPKNYDPDKKPDPERWLPLRDRSYFRPKGKKKKGGRGGGAAGGMSTQGGVVNEDSRPDAPAQQQQQQQQPKKGKGKGK